MQCRDKLFLYSLKTNNYFWLKNNDRMNKDLISIYYYLLFCNAQIYHTHSIKVLIELFVFEDLKV